MASTTGTIDFAVKTAGKPCKTWYKIFGSLDISSSQPPLIILHGGPGANYFYLSSISDLHTLHGLTVIFYDQIGGGNSTHLPEKNGDGSFWTEDLFGDELENLLAHFGLGGETGAPYDILGQSWGGMFASRFASSGRPRVKGLRRLVIADSPSSMPAWVRRANEQKLGLPQEVQDALNKHERDGTTDSKEYKDAVDVFYAKHTCRLNPWPEDVIKSFQLLDEDPTVYQTMNGPSEFYVVGTLKNWDITSELHKISVTTLIVHGRYDTADDAAVLPFFLRIPHVKWVQFSDSSHMPHWEERERYMQIVGSFLTD